MLIEAQNVLQYIKVDYLLTSSPPGYLEGYWRDAMNYDQGILDAIKEMQEFAKEMRLETVLADLEKVLEGYAEDLRSLDELQETSSKYPTSKPGTQAFNA